MMQRSKSLGRADRQSYAFGSSTPRELSHLNLPQKYRVVTASKSRVTEALHASPVRRAHNYDSLGRKPRKPPAVSIARSTSEKTRSVSPKKTKPKESPQKKKRSKPPVDDAEFVLGTNGPVMAGHHEEDQGILDDIRDKLADAGGAVSAGLEAAKDAAADMKDEIAGKVSDLVGDHADSTEKHIEDSLNADEIKESLEFEEKERRFSAQLLGNGEEKEDNAGRSSASENSSQAEEKGETGADDEVQSQKDFEVHAEGAIDDAAEDTFHVGESLKSHADNFMEDVKEYSGDARSAMEDGIGPLADKAGELKDNLVDKVKEAAGKVGSFSNDQVHTEAVGESEGNFELETHEEIFVPEETHITLGDGATHVTTTSPTVAEEPLVHEVPVVQSVNEIDTGGVGSSVSYPKQDMEHSSDHMTFEHHEKMDDHPHHPTDLPGVTASKHTAFSATLGSPEEGKEDQEVPDL